MRTQCAAEVSGSRQRHSPIEIGLAVPIEKKETALSETEYSKFIERTIRGLSWRYGERRLGRSRFRLRVERRRTPSGEKARRQYPKKLSSRLHQCRSLSRQGRITV
jgi:hypothetical protein